MHANSVPCAVLYRPDDPIYAEEIRRFQGCPTVAVSRGGRIFLGWYSGGRCEPHMENYNLLVYSDDAGQTWSQPLLVIPSSVPQLVQALDIQLWCDPDGRLWVFWVQNNTKRYEEGMTGFVVDGYVFDDTEHAMWCVTCDDPDADDPVFSAPRMLDRGFLRCKPTVLSDGRWLFFNYDQTNDAYGYSISADRGATFVHHYGAKKLAAWFDEGMAYERRDGAIRMLARCHNGYLAETVSYDGGLSWEETRPSDITAADTRFFIARTPTGRLLLVHNDCPDQRTNMTLSLSEDDGATWKYRVCVDTRRDISYPDADFSGGRIVLTYDRERTGAREILFVSFTEEDIMTGRPILPSVVSRPGDAPS